MQCSPLNSKELIAVPIHVGIDVSDKSSDLNSDLDLTLALSSVSLKVTGCSSGYTQTINVWNGNINLYSKDTNCVVKLVSFVLNGQTYEVLNGSPLDPT